MPFFNRGRIQLNKTFFNSFGSGGGPIPPLPPIRPDSYLKYSFTQEPTQAIIDRVDSSKQLTTTIGTDVNVIQAKTGDIETFSPLSQAFDIGTGAFIEPSEENLVSNSAFAAVTGWAFSQANIVDIAGKWDDKVLQKAARLEKVTGTFVIRINNVPIVDGDVVSVQFFYQADDGLEPQFSVSSFGDFNFALLGKTYNSSLNYELVGQDSDGKDFYRIYGENITLQNSTNNNSGLFKNTSTYNDRSFLFSGLQIVKASSIGSYIETGSAPAQRDASTPQVPATNVPDSRVVVYTQFIANSEASSNNPVNIAELQFSNDDIVIGYTYDEIPSLVLANSFFVTTPNGSFVIEYTPDQIISKGDEIKINLYINETIVTLEYENITNGEKGLLQNTSVFVDLGVGDIIKLGQTDALSANYMTLIDFEVTAYTDPSLPDFADNGDFANNGDFA